MLARMQTKGNPFALWWECKLVQPLRKIVWEFLKKLKIELPYHPAIALVGIYPKDTKMFIQRGTCIPMFIAALSTRAKLWKVPKCPSTDEWIEKIWRHSFGPRWRAKHFSGLRGASLLPNPVRDSPTTALMRPRASAGRGSLRMPLLGDSGSLCSARVNGRIIPRVWSAQQALGFPEPRGGFLKLVSCGFLHPILLRSEFRRLLSLLWVGQAGLASDCDPT
ncbi:uncharacterized protein LOC109255394 [Panthera pardus]|uniref:Uncharacterized protein LOC109255394 n=1 Tax=Panthera pardus TaxID=9691 RepID=A0A9W2W5P0_PANPR|nr:uncharacterized protein LOC109255394 [Panthera pardus]